MAELTNNVLLPTFPRVLRFERKKRGLSVPQAAVYAGVLISRFMNFERGAAIPTEEEYALLRGIFPDLPADIEDI